ncbi:tryptophan halogenase family protein [Noviherbaspirillum pedocola]|uniref:Tryptophan 7-halogenase n=1 Tax=Noviherbaspirillum pedocola TaxID=2801341 RepID=A0A934SWI9_9BURK|nr:tryptophan halogenase family protein [Noviherbaspirillum pedocola]MBK4736670.1 tryptophan 7-halogenase [Noviherbaspirillum pedocola]
MGQELIRELVILGGGTAGWMTAAALSRALNGRVSVTLVESEDIGTVGVGEATIPAITLFNRMLDIDEDDFLRATQGTFKLGIEFIDWGDIGNRYMHAFGHFPSDIQIASFEQVWQKMRRHGHAHELSAYSITRAAASAGKFMRPDESHPLLDNLAYAFHFDASLYARYLRRYSEARGVKRVEGRVVDVRQDPVSGDIAALVMEGGAVVSGEFFVDCSGFRGRLIEEVLHTGYEDWSHWLPCDRAVFVPSASNGGPLPYTRASAHGAGWQWRIPLQHRVGNGYVHSSLHVSEDEAVATLLGHLDGEALAAPRTLRFKAGMRRRAWNRNCVAIGLAGGFLEPLESTSIHLVQTAISRLLAFFPAQRQSLEDIAEFNRRSRQEYEHVRDFVILHYHATRRNDTAFWNHCRTMEIPESLAKRIRLYRAQGRIAEDNPEIFTERNWVQVLQGQGIEPEGYAAILDVVDSGDIEDYLASLRSAIASLVEAMPSHGQWLQDLQRGQA